MNEGYILQSYLYEKSEPHQPFIRETTAIHSYSYCSSQQSRNSYIDLLCICSINLYMPFMNIPGDHYFKKGLTGLLFTSAFVSGLDFG